MKSILLVDNEAVVAAGLQRSLGKFGFHVTIATSTCAARNLVECEQFDLILVDFDLMPKGASPEPGNTPCENSTSWSRTGLTR